MPTATSPLAPEALSVTGPVTLADVSRWRVAFAGTDSSLLILTDSGPWDLAGLQLLLAMLGEGERRGVTIQIEGIPGVLRELAKRAGLADRLERFVTIPTA